MDTGGGGTTTVQQNPPQLLPEGREGYEMGQKYYKDILKNPPIYEGPRVAPINPTQDEFMRQGRNSFGSKPGYQDSAERHAYATTEGDYLYDPSAGMGYDPNKEYGRNPFYSKQYQDIYKDGRELSDTSLIRGGIGQGNPALSFGAPSVSASKADYRPSEGWSMPGDADIQKFVDSASDPYLRKLNETTLPSIQSDFGVAGGGVNNTREQITKQGALDQTSQVIATDVIAPIFNQMQQLDEHFKNAEREREAALAAGDADRYERASEASAQAQVEMSRLNGELAMRGREIDANLRIAGSDIESQGLRAQASNILQNTEGERGRMLNAREGERNRALYSEEGAADRALKAWDSERGRMVTSAGQAPDLMRTEMDRLNFLRGVGDYERAFDQEAIQAQRDAWAEPINTQSSAATALFGGSGAGPGGASSVVDSNTNEMAQMFNSAMSMAMMAGIAYAS